jgi:hypothetical protein
MQACTVIYLVIRQQAAGIADFTGALFKSGAFVKNTIANAVLNRTSFNAMQSAYIVFDGPLGDCYFEIAPLRG